jgi:hypothetical protein
VRSPQATGLASSLSGCTFVSQVSGAICSIADARKVFTDPAEIPCPPRCVRSVCPAFQRLSFGGLPCDNRQSRPPVLIHSCNHYPLGNCDSPKLETSSDYLTRLGAVSNRTSPPSSLFALTDSARTLPEELVNPASPPSVFQLDFRGAWPTSLTLPFPGHPGVSLRRLPEHACLP